MNGDLDTSAEAEETHPTPRRRWMLVNRKLLPVKGFYFLFFAAVGDLLPFISIYMKQLGLSSGETGIIYGVMPFIAFFVRPIFGALADRLRRHTLVLMIFSILTGIFFTLLLVVPAKPEPLNTVPVRINIHCNNIDSFIKDCQETYRPSKECRLTLTEYKNLTLGESVSVNGSEAEVTTQYGGYTVLNNKKQDEKDIVCQARCEFTMPGAYGSKVCFMRDSSEYKDRNCEHFWISSTSDTHLEFSMLNMTDVMKHEIEKDRLEAPDLHCLDYDMKWLQHEGKLYWKMNCDRDYTLHCDLQCGKMVPNKCSKSQVEDSFGLTFWVFFVIYLFANIAFAPVISLVDAIAYDILGKERNRWGFQRVFGTIGFALFAVTSTFIMDAMRNQNKEVNYSVTFYLFGILSFLAAIDAKLINVSSDLSCGKFLKNIGKLFTYFHITAFLLVAMFFGILTGAIEGFLFWYLLDLGSSQIILGLCLVLNCSFEVVFLSFSGHIIQKIGHIPCLYMACIAYAIRFLVYSFLENPWYVLLIEPIHGVNFGIMWAAASSYASIIAPPGMQATIQGLVGGLHFGFGKGIGSLITGYLFEAMGERWTFRTLSISAVVVLIVYMALNVFVLKYPSTRDASKPVTLEKEETTEDFLSAAQDGLLNSSTNQEKSFNDTANEKKVPSM